MNSRLSRRSSTSSIPVSKLPTGSSVHSNPSISSTTSTATSTTTANPNITPTPNPIFGRQPGGWPDQVADAKVLNGLTGAMSGASISSATLASKTPMPPLHSHQPSDNQVKFVHSTMEILENQIKREEAPKKKRTRTSTEQLRILQKAFATDPMPNSSARLALSKRLGMNARAVQVWFQNRRAKEKLDAKRMELGLISATSYAGSNDSGDLSDFDGDANGFAVEIDDSENGNHDETGGEPNGNLFNSLKATGMLSRFAFSNSSSSNNGLVPKLQRSTSTPNGTSGMFLSGNFGGSSLLPFHQQHHASFFPSSSSFLADVNEASVDDLYQELGTGSVQSPNDVAVGSEFYGALMVDRAPSVSPVGFGAARLLGGSSHNTALLNSASPVPFSNVFGDFSSVMNADLLLSSVFPANSATSSSSSNATISSSHHNHTHNNNSSNNACRGPHAGNVYLTPNPFTPSFSNTTNTTNANNPTSTNTTIPRRSFSLPEAHGPLSPGQLQNLEQFGLQMFPSPLLSIEEDGTGLVEEEVLSQGGVGDGKSRMVFNEFLENEVIR